MRGAVRPWACLAFALATACASGRPSPAPAPPPAAAERKLDADAPQPLGGDRIRSATLSFEARAGWRSLPPSESLVGREQGAELVLEKIGTATVILAGSHVSSGLRLEDLSARTREQARSKNAAATYDERRFFLDPDSLAPASLARIVDREMTMYSLTSILGDRVLLAVAVGTDLTSHEAETVELLRSIRFAAEPKP